jgi:hypothetical protein
MALPLEKWAERYSHAWEAADDEAAGCKALREYWNLEVGRRIHPPEGWGT